jgi:hypothetical protein
MRLRTYHNDNKSVNSPGPGNYTPNFDIQYKGKEKYTMRPKTADLKANMNNPGPGQYSIRNDKSDLKQPSYVFGKDNKFKPNNSASEFPGPGNYSSNINSVSIQQPKFSFGKELRGQNSEFKARVKTPGPGQYDQKESFGTGPKISMSFNRPTTSKSKSETPGPGMYSLNQKNMISAPQYK